MWTWCSMPDIHRTKAAVLIKSHTILSFNTKLPFMHKLMNIPRKYASNDDDLIDLTHESILYNKNCQHQLQPRQAVVVPPFLRQVAPSAVNRRRRWWRGRSPGCSWGGRSGREGGRSEGSSGGPPRRSALSCIPKYTAEKTMSKIHGRAFCLFRDPGSKSITV